VHEQHNGLVLNKVHDQEEVLVSNKRIAAKEGALKGAIDGTLPFRPVQTVKH
jgi:hypothetical protein